MNLDVNLKIKKRGATKKNTAILMALKHTERGTRFLVGRKVVERVREKELVGMLNKYRM